MQSKAKKNVISIILVLIMLISFGVNASAADNLDDKLSDAQNQKNAVKQKSEETQKYLDSLGKDMTNITAYIKTLDAKLAEANSQITSLDAQISDKEAAIATNEVLLADAQQKSKEQYEAMKLRIQYMYEHESDSYLLVILASKDIKDMLNRAEYINKITSYDRQMLTEYAQTIQLVQDTKASLESDRAALGNSRAAVEAEKASLELIQNAKSTELKNLESKTAEAKAYANQLSEEEKKFDNEIASIEQQIKNRPQDNGGSTPNYDGGKFLWPVPASKRITSYFGEVEDRTGPHQGLDIGASRPGVWGDQILAAYDGEVLISQYSSSAGYYICIYHGNNVYTYYMHCQSNLQVSVGQKVSKGQLLAYMGSTGSSTGAHLHFGVRVNGSYVNPLNYLTK